MHYQLHWVTYFCEMWSEEFKKSKKKYWGRKIHKYETQKHPPVPSITPLFNLLALRNKLNPKSFLMECLFCSPHLFVCNIFFNVVFYVCSLLIFFSQPDVNITWITGHIHRSIVDKVNPSSEYVELVYKKCIINYIGLHRREAYIMKNVK
jgi:hypothetical protein